MGIDGHAVRFLEHAMRVGGPLKSTLTIGRQRIDVPERDLQHYLRLQHLGTGASSRYVDELLVEEFGATAVTSVDASDYEGATYVRDLNIELEPGFPQFDTIVDAGTLEHIFDVRVSFRNIGRCCKLGGQILHILPCNNFVGHGFYQFSPELFYSLYSGARGFEKTEVYLADRGKLNSWWQVAAPVGASRSTAMSSRELYVLVRTRKVADVESAQAVQQSDYRTIWAEHDQKIGSEPGLSDSYRRGIVGRLVDRLPDEVRSRIVINVSPIYIQARRRLSRGISSRNAALTRVAVPLRRS